MSWKELKFLQDDSFKDLSSADEEKLTSSLVNNNFSQPFYVWHCTEEDVVYCLDGKHRTRVLYSLIESGVEVPELLPATFVRCENKQAAAKLVLIYSSYYAKITETGFEEFISTFNLSSEDIKLEINLPEISFTPFISTADNLKDVRESLAQRFVVPPFSILDTRQGYWQERKKLWNMLMNSQETREDINLIAKSGQGPGIYALRNNMRETLNREPSWDEIIAEAKKKGLHVYEGASIFDPVLCEVLYTWFCPDQAVILDPFAGGSVRGIVASFLHHQYHGIDLRFDQVNANMKQAEKLMTDGITWYTGDSSKMDDILSEELMVDFIFSCPPYHDLEHYSDDPLDLSNMDYFEFRRVYREIITKAVNRLKPNRFACFVVGDIRDSNGFYRDFVSETINCFTQCIDDDGMYIRLYNEIILVNVAGSLPVRVGRQFEGYRKVGKMHQNVLVFYKGDPKKIKEEFPEIKVEELLAQVE